METPSTICFQMLDINFDIWKKIVEGSFHKYPIKIYIKDGKILTHFGLILTVFPGSLTDLSA
jgi:hypothetical protein